MSATLNGADRKLFSFSDRDNMPPVALLAKNLLIHIYSVIKQGDSLQKLSNASPLLRYIYQNTYLAILHSSCLTS